MRGKKGLLKTDLEISRNIVEKKLENDFLNNILILRKMRKYNWVGDFEKFFESIH